MELNFSIEEKQLCSVFKEYRNSVDIYTEDNDKDKEFYRILFERLLHDTDLIINDIYPLGSSKDVIQKCKNDKNKIRRKLYIVDGDIFLQNNPKEIIPNLFILDSYCIENYVIDEDSICNTAYNLYGRNSLQEIYTKINYNNTMLSIAKPLIQLFFHYSIHYECLEKFRLLHIDYYVTNNTLDITKINLKNDEIKSCLISNGISEKQYQFMLQNRISKFPYNINSLLTIVSGKDFLIPFLSHHFKKQLNCQINIPKESWKFNLVKYCNLNRLSKLKQAIVSA